MKCPVCDKRNRSLQCPNCGFDGSKDYMKYPTFGAVEKTPSATALRSERTQHTAGPDETGRKKPWRSIAACFACSAAMLALGIAIGLGLRNEKPEPTEPKAVISTTKTNVLRADELPDAIYKTDGNKYPVFGSEYQRQDIRSVTFEDTLEDIPVDAWDVSADGNGTVMAWVEPNGMLYDLYIAGDGGVWADTSCRDMFSNYVNVDQFTFGGAFHTDEVQTMHAMFSDCDNLISLDLSGFNTASVQDMSWMLCGCDNLTSVDMSGFNTSNVQYMSLMFYGCDSLNGLDLSGFDTAKVQYLSWMFCGCEAMTDLKLGSRFVNRNAAIDDMFSGCPAGADYQHLLS